MNGRWERRSVVFRRFRVVPWPLLRRELRDDYLSRVPPRDHSRHEPPRGDDARQIRARQSVAGRFGFILGCVAAVAAATINLWRAPRPLTVASVALAILMAALNVPFGIALGLLGERLTRPRK
jgi:hypothetical protein